MPQSGAIFTTRRTASAPARCPEVRGRPRRVAQRPFPSMTMATCKEVLCVIKLSRKKKVRSACARRANQRFHVIEVALERPPADGGETVFGFGDAGFERLLAADVLRVFELARVHAEVAVARLQQRLELVEGEALAYGEGAHDCEPHAFVDQPVECCRRRLRLGFDGSRAIAVEARQSRRVALSHRTSVR